MFLVLVWINFYLTIDSFANLNALWMLAQQPIYFSWMFLTHKTEWFQRYTGFSLPLNSKPSYSWKAYSVGVIYNLVKAYLKPVRYHRDCCAGKVSLEEKTAANIEDKNRGLKTLSWRVKDKTGTKLNLFSLFIVFYIVLHLKWTTQTQSLSIQHSFRNSSTKKLPSLCFSMDIKW